MWSSLPAVRDFYPRPPRGGRRIYTVIVNVILVISIHALREEGNHILAAGQRPGGNFYPRPPRGGRRRVRRLAGQGKRISIHALREEDDCNVKRCAGCVFLFLSTPSARRTTCQPFCVMYFLDLFLSTPSVRRATITHNHIKTYSCTFLSTPSVRRATLITTTRSCQIWISIHALREEGDLFL